MPIINMISNVAESFPEGAYAPFYWNRPTELAKHPAMNPNGLPYGPVIVYSSHHGVCLHERERNMYDDSDFYMTVWNAEKGEPEEICYASTRGWSYPCMGSSVDATPEVRAAYEAWLAVKQAQARVDRRRAKARALWAVRAAMQKAAAKHGFSYYRLLTLHNAQLGQWEAVMYLVTASIRSGFKLSIRDQALAWLRNPSPEYSSPLSYKQMKAVPIYKN